MPSSKRTSAARREAPRRPKEERRSWPFAVPSKAELAVAFGRALDLGEGKEPGHAARACYIALNLAQAVDLPPEEWRVVYYGALLHDAGAVPASAEACRLLNLTESALFVSRPDLSPQQLALEIAPAHVTTIVDVLHQHQERGVKVARDLGFDVAVQQAIATHHERWDGHGYTRALKGDAIPITGQLVAAADLIEALIAADGNPLTARRNLVAALAENAGGAIAPTIAGKARELARSDTFWLGLHDGDLAAGLANAAPEDPADYERSLDDLRAFASVFGALADTKGTHTANHSKRCAELADRIAQALGFAAPRRELLRIAAMVADVGLMGVPARIMAKPDILSLTEMETMRRHPAHSHLVLSAIPGMEELARWAGAHHERPDGKGYPEMLQDEAIPLEARIIAIADTYVALTSARPYRQALSHEDAQRVLLGGAGTQLDRKLVDLAATAFAAPKSSRTAPRQRRTR